MYFHTRDKFWLNGIKMLIVSFCVIVSLSTVSHAADDEYARTWVIIKNEHADDYSDDNAQIVTMKAPAVGNSQIRFSALLNNVIVDPSNFALQLGFSLSLQPFIVRTSSYECEAGQCLIGRRFQYQPYVVGNDYRFTITHTNGIWNQCVLNVNSGAYHCYQEFRPVTGSTLKYDNGTSIFFENVNSNVNFHSGFSSPMYISQGLFARNGFIQTWTNEQRILVTRCSTFPPLGDMLSGTITGTISLYPSKVPPACGLVRVNEFGNVVVNSGFDNGAPQPWYWYSQNLQYRNNNGIFEVYRSSPTADAVFWHWIPFRVETNSVLEVRADIGNSSGTAKTVHLMVRAPEWENPLEPDEKSPNRSTVRGCWINVPANTSLRYHFMRVRTNTNWVWREIWLQVWVPTADNAPWLRFDNFSVQYSTTPMTGDVQCP